MASPSGSGTSSGSSGLMNSGGSSEEDLQQLMDQRKRKRMISNRESARRSRMRKQKHLDDLMAQVSQLRKENNQIITSINVTTQQYLNVEAENSVLRAQVAELCHRLQSLNEIIDFLNANHGGLGLENDQPPPPPYNHHFNVESAGEIAGGAGFMMNHIPWNHHQLYHHHQPAALMAASADILHY
ncbi:OLC1v1003260C1 [Oldenlandia corymbosa var. corymbosa]|uniref:OLC1v1003260C1 n=1 Tax=Oldenlandia corymbosa var. corymbosa TaxID=529605 RepID=A0AAV1D9M3_OLDCO|nr:OLC1v1003260C1 [Oldenlandia corymbosa var. corymbosa]